MNPRHCAGIRRVLLLLAAATAALFASQAAAHFPEDTVHPLFQFPRDRVPVMDGDLSDWDMLPAEYNFDLVKYSQHKEQTSTRTQPRRPQHHDAPPRPGTTSSTASTSWPRSTTTWSAFTRRTPTPSTTRSRG